MPYKESHAEIKLTIATIFELAYSTDSGVTMALVKKRGPLTIRIDENGEIELSGKAGMIKCSGKPTLDKMGIDLIFGSVMVENIGNGKLAYTANLNFRSIGKVTYTNYIDVEKLLLGCSGLLCQNARALKEREQQYDMLDKMLKGTFK